MTEHEAPAPPPHGEDSDRGFTEHKARQARMGLRLTHLERLHWLERTMEEMRRLCGRAKEGRPVDGGTD